MMCPQCDNHGYRRMIVTPSPSVLTASPQTTVQPDRREVMTFCSCQAGRKLHAITIEFRLADLASMANGILPRLHRAKEAINLGDDATAIQVLDEIRNELERTVEKINKAQTT